MCDCFAWVYTYALQQVWCLKRSKDSTGSSGTKVIDCSKLHCKCREPKLGSSPRAANAFNCWVISLAPIYSVFNVTLLIKGFLFLLSSDLSIYRLDWLNHELLQHQTVECEDFGCSRWLSVWPRPLSYMRTGRHCPEEPQPPLARQVPQFPV